MGGLDSKELVSNEPKYTLTEAEVRELERSAWLVFNYPPVGGRTIPVPAAVLYQLCQEWRRRKGLN